jgi:UPF0716 protein FxsA
MPVVLGVFASLGLWLFSELVAFSLVAHAIGLDGAIVATVLTSLAGAFILHRLGASARHSVLEVVNSGNGLRWFSAQRLSAGLSAGFGAVLLILPGFLSDAIGIFLVARGARVWCSPAEVTRRAPEDVVELSRQEWRHVDERERR